MKKKTMLICALLPLMSAPLVYAEDAQVDEQKIEELTKLIEEKQMELKELKSQLKELQGEEDSDEKIVIVDDENLYIAFTGYEEKEDAFFGKSYEFFFEVENKSQYDVVVQALSVAIDNTMVDSQLVTMSENVAAGKKAKAVMTFLDFTKEGKIPELTGELDMKLSVFSFDNFDFHFEYPFVYEFED